MPQTPQAILEELKKGVYRPLYFLQGTEPFFIDQIVDYIEKNALSESEKGFNQVILYGKDQTVGNVIVQARRFPMMSERQVVVVREAQALPDLEKEEGQNLLAKYAAQPVPSTVLVFAHKYKKLDGRKALSGILDKKATLVNAEPLPDKNLNNWIGQYLKEKGFAAQAGAIELLADHIGNDLSRIAKEIEKLEIGLPAGAEVTKTLIHEKVGISKDYNIFEFQSALAQRNLSKSLQIAQYFAANPKSANIIPVLAMLFGYFTKVLLVHHHRQLPDDQLAKAVGLNSTYFLMDYKKARDRFSKEQVIHILHQIRLADGYCKGIKSGDRSELDIYKELIVQIVKT